MFLILLYKYYFVWKKCCLDIKDLIFIDIIFYLNCNKFVKMFINLENKDRSIGKWYNV